MYVLLLSIFETRSNLMRRKNTRRHDEILLFLSSREYCVIENIFSNYSDGNLFIEVEIVIGERNACNKL